MSEPAEAVGAAWVGHRAQGTGRPLPFLCSSTHPAAASSLVFQSLCPNWKEGEGWGLPAEGQAWCGAGRPAPIPC